MQNYTKSSQEIDPTMQAYAPKAGELKSAISLDTVYKHDLFGNCVRAFTYKSNQESRNKTDSTEIVDGTVAIRRKDGGVSVFIGEIRLEKSSAQIVDLKPHGQGRLEIFYKNGSKSVLQATAANGLVNGTDWTTVQSNL